MSRLRNEWGAVRYSKVLARTCQSQHPNWLVLAGLCKLVSQRGYATPRCCVRFHCDRTIELNDFAMGAALAEQPLDFPSELVVLSLEPEALKGLIKAVTNAAGGKMNPLLREGIIADVGRRLTRSAKKKMNDNGVIPQLFDKKTKKVVWPSETVEERLTRIKPDRVRKGRPEYLDGHIIEALKIGWQRAIERGRSEALTAIARRFRLVSMTDDQQLNIALAARLNLDAKSQKDFIKQCADENGDYLVFRLLSDRKSLVVYYLKIESCSPGIPLAKYTSVCNAPKKPARSLPKELSGGLKTVRGIIYHEGGTRYVALGQLDSKPEVRMTYLSQLQESNHRPNFCGVRLGIGVLRDAPTAYRVWCAPVDIKATEIPDLARPFMLSETRSMELLAAKIGSEAKLRTILRYLQKAQAQPISSSDIEPAREKRKRRSDKPRNRSVVSRLKKARQRS